MITVENIMFSTGCTFKDKIKINYHFSYYVIHLLRKDNIENVPHNWIV